MMVMVVVNATLVVALTCTPGTGLRYDTSDLSKPSLVQTMSV